MTTKTWDNSTGLFDSATEWSPPGSPQPGDIAIINGGTVTAGGDTLQGLFIQVNGTGSNAPIFNLTDSVLASTSYLAVSNTAIFGVGTAPFIGIVGQSLNAGVITMSGTVSRLILSVDSAGSAGTLVNSGSLNSVNASPQVGAAGSTGGLVNNGSIATWNPSGSFQEPVYALGISGTGVISLQPNTAIDLNQAVGVGQTVRFDGAAGSSSVMQIDSASSFQATIAGFASGDDVTLTNVSEGSYAYTPTDANDGVLTIYSGAAQTGSVLANLSFSGTYTAASFGVSTVTLDTGAVNTLITSNAGRAANFSYTDVSLGGLTSTSAGQGVNGSSIGLQQQFNWSSADSSAIRSNVGNTSVTGGSAADAIQVVAGVNVVNGGAGSNFLVGGTGAGSQDNFYMDGRAGANWDTIVNFHAGDIATFVGFNAGTQHRELDRLGRRGRLSRCDAAFRAQRRRNRVQRFDYLRRRLASDAAIKLSDLNRSWLHPDLLYLRGLFLAAARPGEPSPALRAPPC